MIRIELLFIYSIAADYLSTLLAFTQGATEQNPLMAHTGSWEMGIIAALAGWVTIAVCRQWGSVQGISILAGASAMHFAAVGTNAIILF